MEWVATNDVADIASLTHLLRHDSVYGPFPGPIEDGDGFIRVDGVEIPVLAETIRPGCRGPSSARRS